MVDFLCKVLLKLWETRVKNYRMENSCQLWDLTPVSSAYEANALSIALLDLIFIKHLKVDHAVPEYVIYTVPVPRGGCSTAEAQYSSMP